MDGAICLHNIAIETEMHSEDIPWLSGNAKAKDRIVRNSKAPLWSPPIPHSLGMRCITMDYKITVETEDTEIYGLAMLQQQDGWLPSFLTPDEKSILISDTLNCNFASFE